MDIPSYLMGKSAGGKSASTQVVTELPETGQPNVIYLVPKQTAGQDDVFDEYIWVNNDWELIGSTAIDISGKQDVMQFSTMPTADSTTVGKIIQYVGSTTNDYTNGYFYIGTTDGTNYGWSSKNVQDGASLPIYVLNTTNRLDQNDNQTADFGSSEKTQLGTIVSDAYAKGYNNIALLLCSTTSGATYMFYSVLGIGPNINIRLISNTIYRYSFLENRSLSAAGTWNNSVCTISTFSITTTMKQPLLPTNTVQYTPTADYNPATKKYVDDTVAAAITTALGGSY